MFELIKVQAALVQERLWDLAINDYGLIRNQETIDRIRATLKAVITEKAAERGHATDPVIDNSTQRVDTGLALAFLAATLAERETDHEEAICMLATAAEALGSVMAFGALQTTVDDRTLVKAQALAMARRRHAEHYALSDLAIKYWRNNIPPDLSAQKAASELLRVVPLSHKKLAELVSTEKKKVSRVRRLELVRKP